jgi:hypothetical protein
VAKRADTGLKLPDDFLGTVAALLNTPPPKGKKRATRKTAKQPKAAKRRKS